MRAKDFVQVKFCNVEWYVSSSNEKMFEEKAAEVSLTTKGVGKAKKKYKKDIRELPG